MSKTVVVVVAGDATRSTTARVHPSVADVIGLLHGCYIQLSQGTSDARYFRVALDDDVQQDDRHLIRVDHWPAYEDRNGSSDTGSTESEVFDAELEIVAPARLRIAQYVSVHPAEADQPRLPLAMAKVLLRKRILHGATGTLHLSWEGVDYGKWRYHAYYRGDSKETGFKVEAGVVTDDTMISLSSFSAAQVSRETLQSKLQQPGIGLHGAAVQDLLTLALYPPTDSTAQTDALRPHSIILHGPSGSGKTTLIQLVTEALHVNVLTLDATILATPHYRIEDSFTAALRIQPCILLLENLELIFPRAVDETKYKLVCRFVACLDRIRSMAASQVVVVGTVTNLRALNAKIHQSFAEEIPMKAPTREWTVRLFESVLPHPDSVPDELKLAVAVKYGQRPSNTVTLARRLQQHNTFHDGASDASIRSDIEKFGREIASATGSTQALRTSVPNVRWEDIGGLHAVKQSLLEMVVWPLERPAVFVKMGITPPLGMLLHGPPGTGKTMLAKAAARASGCNFLNVSASDLMKAEFGESEKAVARVFDTARALSPCLVFIDEFQSLFGNRSTAGATTSRMISQLLVEMDSLKALAEDRDRRATDGQGGSGDRIFVLAATNAVNAIDPAFLQPGRFENILYVGLPSMDERRAILDLQRQKMPLHEDVDLQLLAQATEGANAASVVALCHAAAIKAMQRSDEATTEPCIDMQDFHQALAGFDFGVDQLEDDRSSSLY